LANGLGRDELSEAFDGIKGLAALVDKTFVGQVEQELATFQNVTGRNLNEAQTMALTEVLDQSMRAIWADVAMTHPNFRRVALELSKESAVKLGIE
jgi:hypothetical protein